MQEQIKSFRESMVSSAQELGLTTHPVKEFFLKASSWKKAGTMVEKYMLHFGENGEEVQVNVFIIKEIKEGYFGIGCYYSALQEAGVAPVKEDDNPIIDDVPAPAGFEAKPAVDAPLGQL